MRKMVSIRYIIITSLFFTTGIFLYAQKSSILFIVSMDQPATHRFHVVMNYKGLKGDSIDLKMPVWTPGYYQRLDFANNVENFNAADASGKTKGWRKISGNTWRVNNSSSSAVLDYDVKTTRPFVATTYLDEERGYIVPAGVFFFPAGEIQHAVTLVVKPYEKWNKIATGLDTVAGKKYTFTASDFDILYDSPLLVGNLEEFP